MKQHPSETAFKPGRFYPYGTTVLVLFIIVLGLFLAIIGYAFSLTR